MFDHVRQPENHPLQVFGEIAHFLIATTSKDVAGDIHYGDQVKLPKKKMTEEYSGEAIFISYLFLLLCKGRFDPPKISLTFFLYRPVLRGPTAPGL